MTKKTGKKQPKRSGGAERKKKKPAKKSEQLAAAKTLAVAQPVKREVTAKPAKEGRTANDIGAVCPNAPHLAKRPNPAATEKPATVVNEELRSSSEDRKVMDRSAAPADVAEAAQPLQTLAAEMQRMAKQSIEQTSDVLERLRDARSVEEVVSLQTTFMQQSFRRYTELASRIGELMTSSQTSLFQQSQAAMRSFRSMASGA